MASEDPRLDDPQDVAELARRAWKQIDAALKTGKLTTELGIELELKPGEYARLCQWVAGQDTKKRPKGIPLSGFVVKETTG